MTHSALVRQWWCRWTRGPRTAGDDQARTLNRLRHLKMLTVLVLNDCQGNGRAKLLRAVHASHSTDDLWFLRPEIYGQVALAHGELEARRRLQQLAPFLGEGPFGAQRPSVGVGALNAT